MPKQWRQYIGDDQLVSGLPKHTSAQATGEPVPGDPPYRPKPDAEDTPKKVFWVVYLKEKVCEKCKATYQFFCLGCVNVDVTNRGSGALLPDVNVHSNWTGWYESLVPPTKTVHFDRNALADTHVFWSIQVMSGVADNSPLESVIQYEV